jgi:hypothetical protein
MSPRSRSTIFAIVVVAAIAVIAGLFHLTQLVQTSATAPQQSSPSPTPTQSTGLPEPNLLSPFDFLAIEYPTPSQSTPVPVPPSAGPPYAVPPVASTQLSTTTINDPGEVGVSPPSAVATITCSQLTATIDKRSLMSTSTNPTITGTVSNVTSSGTTIYIVIYSGSRRVFRSGSFAIVDNRWSIPFYQGSLSPGIYTVFVYDHLYQNCSDKLRAIGTLTVKS